MPRCVRNDHHREERNQRREQHAVNEDHEAGALQILQLGVRDFAVHLGQALFAAHRQQRVAQAHQNGDERNRRRRRSPQPAESLLAEMQIGQSRQRYGLVTVLEDRDQAPPDQDHHHYRRDLHNAQSLFAGFVNADDVLAPEIYGDRRREDSREIGWMHVQAGDLQVLAGLVDEAAEVQARAHAADRAGKHVVEHERGHREFGQRAAHSLVYDLVHAAAHEHATAFDVDGAHRI